MAIAVVSSTTNFNSAAGFTIPKPATVNNNDILVAIFAGKASSTGTVAVPASWVKYELNSATGNDNYAGIAYLTVPNAATLSATFAFTSGVTQTNACWLGSLSGVNSTTPEDVSFASKWNKLSNDTSPNLVSQTTATDNVFAFAAWTVNEDTATTLPTALWGTTFADDLGGILNVVGKFIPTAGTASGTAELTDVASGMESISSAFLFRELATVAATTSVNVNATRPSITAITGSPTITLLNSKSLETDYWLVSFGALNDVTVSATKTSFKVSAGTVTISNQKSSYITATRCNASVNVRTVTIANQKNSYTTATRCNASLNVRTVTLNNQKSSYITATRANASLTVGTTTRSNQKNTYITATRANASFVVGSPTIQAESGPKQVNFNASLIIGKLTVGSVIISTVKSSYITATRANASFLVGSVTTTNNKNTTVAATTIRPQISVRTVTVTANKNTYISASTVTAKWVVGTATVQVGASIIVATTRANASLSVRSVTLNIQKNTNISVTRISSTLVVNQPTIFTEKHTSKAATTISSKIVVNSATVSTQKVTEILASVISQTLSVRQPSISTQKVSNITTELISIRTSLFTATVTITGPQIFSEIDNILLLQSRIIRSLLTQSKIERSYLTKSEILRKLLKKSSMAKQEVNNSRIDRGLLVKSEVP